MTRLVIFRDRKHEYRWRLIARNGRIIADSGEGYVRKSGAVKAATKLMAINWAKVKWQ